VTIPRAIVSALVFASLVLQVVPGAGRAEGTAPVVVPLQEGILSIRLASDWEMNPRLAEDNGVPLFLHPGGAKDGEKLSTWFLIDRRPRPPGEDLDHAVARILREGVQFGFALRDSSEIRTADNRPLWLFRFQSGDAGEERGMGLIETPTALLVFRYESADLRTWESRWGSIDSMLRSTTLAVRDRP
jgi:hypothetical protein